jgi:hypothetical protein
MCESNGGIRFLGRTIGGAYVVLGGSVITAYGFAALLTSIDLNGLTTLSTGDYLRLWSMTYLVIALGFAAILGGYLVASNGEWRHIGGALLGVLGSLVGTILALGLITTVAGLESSISYFAQGSQSAQFSLSYEIQVMSCIAVVVAGFPLAMFGIMRGVADRGHESTQVPDFQESPASSA